MKKTLLIAGLLLALLFPHSACRAQRGNAYNDNTFFWSFDAGATLYQHSGSSAFGMPSASLNFGRWLMRPLAFRIAGDVAMVPSYFTSRAGKSDNSLFLMASAEFMWDINATFFHVYNKRFLSPIPVYPLIGLGLVYRPEVIVDEVNMGAEHDFQAMLGFQLPMRLGPKWDLYLQYKCNFFAETFDGSRENNFMHTFGLGLNHRATDDPFHRRTAGESRSTNDDWFVGFGAGVSFSSFEFEYFTDDRARYWNPTPEIMIGRNYTSVWTIRFELSGFFARKRARIVDGELQPGNWYTFNYLHTDFMINLNHLTGINRGHKWSFLPYFGAGPIWVYKSKPAFDVAADGGIFVRRYIDNMSDFYIDLKYVMAPPRIAGSTGASGSIFSVGYPMLTIGYLCNFGHSTTRYRMPVNSDIN